MKSQPVKTSPDQQAKREAAKKPSKNDKQEGVVQTSPRPPQQSQIDQERGDWEGMGQSRYQPEEDKPKSGLPITK